MTLVLSSTIVVGPDWMKLRGDFGTEVHFLSARDHAYELSLTCGESEDGSKGRFL
jgi:hypothetical protein